MLSFILFVVLFVHHSDENHIRKPFLNNAHNLDCTSANENIVDGIRYNFKHFLRFFKNWTSFFLGGLS